MVSVREKTSAVRRVLSANLESVTERIFLAAEKVGRDPDSIRTIAVTKYVDFSVARELVSMGVRHLGENRWQVARPKLENLTDPAICWHWIGHLQTNKVRKILAHFQEIHSVDRLSLIEELKHRIDKNETTPVRFPVYLQVNVSGERTKFGAAPDDVERLGAEILTCEGLEWVGLMTMAPHEENPERTRPVFARLREIRDNLQERLGVDLPRLSMGMSNDFEVAVQEGSTDLRIGTLLYKGLL